MRAVWKLLVLVAVLLLPLGMAPVATAAPVSDHHMATPMSHCPEQAPDRHSKGGFAECTMGCSAALPAVERANDQLPLLICAPSEAAAIRILRGLHPDTATPPPKRS